MVALFIFVNPSYSEELTDFDFTVPPKSEQSRSSKPECKFDNLVIPANAVIYAAGAYSGRKVDFQIDQSGHQATQFDIAVNSKNRPVILMLGAYEPTVWNIGWSPDTKILAVLASGYHRQVIAGLASKTPTIISSYDNKGSCGYFYIGKGQNSSLNPKARSLFGKPVELVFMGDKTGKIVIGDELSSTDKLVTSAKSSPKSFKDLNAPLAGKVGLKDAVSKGILRPATIADANRWVDELVKNTPEQDVPPIAGQGKPKPNRPRLQNAYVVLAQFTYPAGLYGGNLATFFIEHGVAKPKGNPGHSAVYNFNTLRCHGAACVR